MLKLSLPYDDSPPQSQSVKSMLGAQVKFAPGPHGVIVKAIEAFSLGVHVSAELPLVVAIASIEYLTFGPPVCA